MIGWKCIGTAQPRQPQSLWKFLIVSGFGLNPFRLVLFSNALSFVFSSCFATCITCYYSQLEKYKINSRISVSR